MASGPCQVRCDFRSFASGELAGIEQVRAFCRSTVSRSGAVVLMVSILLQRRGERSVEVVDDVVHVLDADADADEAGEHARVDELLLAELGVGGRRGMDDER